MFQSFWRILFTLSMMILLSRFLLLFDPQGDGYVDCCLPLALSCKDTQGDDVVFENPPPSSPQQGTCQFSCKMAGETCARVGDTCCGDGNLICEGGVCKERATLEQTCGAPGSACVSLTCCGATSQIKCAGVGSTSTPTCRHVCRYRGQTCRLDSGTDTHLRYS